MLWNLLTAGIFGTDYYIKKKINTSEKKDLKEKCLGGRLIVRNCHNHGMMLGILKNKDKKFLRACIYGAGRCDLGVYTYFRRKRHTHIQAWAFHDPGRRSE